MQKWKTRKMAHNTQVTYFTLLVKRTFRPISLYANLEQNNEEHEQNKEEKRMQNGVKETWKNVRTKEKREGEEILEATEEDKDGAEFKAKRRGKVQNKEEEEEELADKEEK